MVNYNFKVSNGDRDDVIKYIIEKKRNGNFKVVDVGGSLSGWSSNYVDCIIDFNDATDSKIQHFKCDITHADSWKDILQYVETNGKFDFCICTHTLEDIMNPVFVSEQIQKIAREGYIAVPSKYRELSRFENGNSSYRGYIHHRWVFDYADNIFIGYPKINYLETSIFDKIADLDNNKYDLSFYWKDNIDIRYLNNNYLGPDVRSVMTYYNHLIE